jgi:hypothetical protein
MRNILSRSLVLTLAAVSGALVLAATPPTDPTSRPASAPAATAPATPVAELHVREGWPHIAALLRQRTALRPIHIAYLGGGMTNDTPSWRSRLTAGLRAEYPKAVFLERVTGIPGTGVLLGAFRTRRDVLAADSPFGWVASDGKSQDAAPPDALILEFAANDRTTAPADIRRALEGIIRQARSQDPVPDMLLVYQYQEADQTALAEGTCPKTQALMERIADYYQIPSICLGVDIARQVAEGRVAIRTPEKAPATVPPTPAVPLTGKTVYSYDGLHPTPAGEALIDRVYARTLPALLSAPEADANALHALPDPLEKASYDTAHIVAWTEVPDGKGFERLPADALLNKVLARQTGPLFVAQTPGAEITINFKGTTLGVVDVIGPDCGQISVQVDNKPATLYTRFDSYANQARTGYLLLARDLPEGPHRVRITLAQEAPDKGAILARRNMKAEPAEKYAHNYWYVGGVLLVGELTTAQPGPAAPTAPAPPTTDKAPTTADPAPEPTPDMPPPPTTAPWVRSPV